MSADIDWEDKARQIRAVADLLAAADNSMLDDDTVHIAAHLIRDLACDIELAGAEGDAPTKDDTSQSNVVTLKPG